MCILCGYVLWWLCSTKLALKCLIRNKALLSVYPKICSLPISVAMDTLGGYSSSDEDTVMNTDITAQVKAIDVIPTISRPKVNVAPEVGVESEALSLRLYTNPTATELPVNVPYSDLSQPSLGPANPFAHRPLVQQNSLSGHIDVQAYSEIEFRMQQQTFTAYGYARDPSISGLDGQLGGGYGGTGYVGNVERAIMQNGATVYDPMPKSLRQNQHLKRKPKGDVSIIDGEDAFMGPWAGYENEKIGELAGPSEEERASLAKAALSAKSDAKKVKDIEPGTETSIFHGKSEHDYLGRTYMAVPQDTDVNLLAEAGMQTCFIPKKAIHTYTGHTKGVAAIRLLPNSGHLMLSAGMDSKIKIWDVYHDRKCLRTYLGHSKAVRDITFSNDGRRFLSASYDKYVKLWDTETGACLKTFNTGSTPYCVVFNPDEDKQNIFLTGVANKKILQYDIDSGEITQEYDQHLGAINTITFVDENRRFVTTSDDKTLRAWEFGIPVVIKYIAEPDMHSMPAVTQHPNKKWLACQSLDNQILIYGAKDRFRQNRKKRFTGHLIAGYACKPAFSADGRFLSSGDSEGNIWFWDWKTCKVLKKLRAHEGVVIGNEWHPHETSKVFTCGWDGLIKLWD